VLLSTLDPVQASEHHHLFVRPRHIKQLLAPHTLLIIDTSVITAMGAQQNVAPASPARVWVIAGASRGIGEQYVAQVGPSSADCDQSG